MATSKVLNVSFITIPFMPIFDLVLESRTVRRAPWKSALRNLSYLLSELFLTIIPNLLIFEKLLYILNPKTVQWFIHLI